MANEIVKIDRGLSTNLPSTNDPGRILITTDTNQMYVDDTAENRIHIQDYTKIPLAGSSAISGNLVPSTTNANNLGSSTNEWNNIYGNIIHGNVIHAPTLATNEIEPDTNTKLVISGGTSNEVDIQSNVGLGGNLTIGSSTNTVVITPTTLTLNNTAKTAWQTELGITEGGLTQEQADDRYLQLTGTAASATQLATSHNFSITGGATASAVAFNGTQDVTLNITSLDATKLSGTIPTANLPSYVDDVVEYANLQAFPPTGESGKIYVALDTNLTYRWGGSNYVEISPSLALGTTADTAFRGDYGQTAYNHANAHGSAFSSGFYKIQTNDQGHVTAAEAVSTSDISTLVDARYLQLTGGTLSGTLNFGDSISIDSTDGLTLNEDMVSQWQSVLAVPTNALTQSSADTRYLQLSGGSLTGQLDVPTLIVSEDAVFSGNTILESSGNLQIQDTDGIAVVTIDGTQGLVFSGNDSIKQAWQTALEIPTNALTQTTADSRYLKLTGGTVTGALSVQSGLYVKNTSGTTTYVTMTASGGLTLNSTALANWQEELEIPKFVVSSTQPSDTNVIWLKPVS